ncbi:ATP-grasp domain-containing protein [Oceanobacillus oncorhynchi]|uniref:ATP-grasp domain-containing protein n=1 Tax=Oceanobacillus oncorhynchi TaxID=545501 RepID=UPI0018686E45|nr:ATP-grasp domain-containing protein [Oceanobacillus oncorhynchi]
MGNILLVGSGGTATKGFVFKTILKKGLSITLIDNGNSSFNRLVDHLIFKDPFTTSEWEDILNEVKKVDKISKITAVLPMSEFTVELASILNEKLGLRGLNSSIAGLTRNKARLREKMRDFNFNSPKFIEADAYSFEKVKSFAGDTGYPLVIKPVDSGGSKGVYRCENIKDLESHFKLIFKNYNPSHVIIEEFIEGPEISAETISQGGKIVFISLTEKVKVDDVNFVESGHVTPCDISDEKANEVKLEAEKLLNMIQLHEGISHIEFKLTQKGPYIIEIGPRAAGAYLPDLIDLAYGINIFDLWIQSISSNKKIEVSPKIKQFAAVSFLYPTSGKVCSIPLPSSLNHKDIDSLVDYGSYCKVGDTFNDKVTSNFDRIGHFVITASNRGDLNHKNKTLSEELTPSFNSRE